MNLLKDLRALFYPETCPSCRQQLVQNEKIICTFCRHDLPLTNFKSYTENKINAIFYGRIPIEKAFALLLLRKKGITKNLIHQLKYHGMEEIGVFFGDWLGEIHSENQEFSSVDFIIPVPIHPKKKKLRGYNQLTKFGTRLQHHLKIPFVAGVLVRSSATATQTLKSRFERFNDLHTKFSILDLDRFKNKHVLLIDDVITTGATLEACALELMKTSGIKISILAMAYTE